MKRVSRQRTPWSGTCGRKDSDPKVIWSLFRNTNHDQFLQLAFVRRRGFASPSPINGNRNTLTKLRAQMSQAHPNVPNYSEHDFLSLLGGSMKPINPVEQSFKVNRFVNSCLHHVVRARKSKPFRFRFVDDSQRFQAALLAVIFERNGHSASISVHQ